MRDYQKYINALRKCAKEHEHDKTSMGHIRVSDLCRDTANLLEELEQEPILDKIKGYVDHIRNTGMGKKKSLEFIEKFIEGLKGESECEE